MIAKLKRLRQEIRKRPEQFNNSLFAGLLVRLNDRLRLDVDPEAAQLVIPKQFDRFEERLFRLLHRVGGWSHTGNRRLRSG